MSPELNDIGRAAAASAAVAGKWEREENARDRSIEAAEAWWYETEATCNRCQAAEARTGEYDHGCYRHADYEELHAHYLGPMWRDVHDDRTCRVCPRITTTYRGPR